MWAINRAGADEKDDVMQKQKFPERKRWCGYVPSLGGLTPMVILDEGTVDHSCYIKNVLPIALKYGNEVFDDNCIFQQDGANWRRDHLTEEWRRDNFPSLIGKDR